MGKSTLLRQLMGDKLALAGGFVTESKLDENGALLGFDIMPAAAAAGVRQFPSI